MKRLEYANSQLKHNLKSSQVKGIKYVLKTLNEEQIDFVQNLGYRVVPYLFEITTKKIKNVKNQSALIKDVHYARTKYGKNKIVRKLTSSQCQSLDSNKIPYKIIKHKIVLNP